MIKCDSDTVKKGLALLEDKNYDEAVDLFENAKEKSDGGVSIVLSLLGMAKYLQDKNNALETLKCLNDARYMAQFSKNDTAKIINEYAQGTVDFGEGNKDVALLHFENAKNIAVSAGDEFSIMGYVLTRIKQIRNNMDFTLPIKSDPLV